MNRFRLAGLVLPLLLAAAQDPAWHEFTVKEGGFTVLLPGKPHEEQQAVCTPGGTIDVNLFSVALQAPDGTYAVGYAQFPEQSVKPGTEERRLDNARAGALAKAGGKLKSEKRIRLERRYPGREILIDVDERTIVRTRFYAVKHNLYQLVAVGARERVESKDTEKFMDSFKLRGDKP